MNLRFVAIAAATFMLASCATNTESTLQDTADNNTIGGADASTLTLYRSWIAEARVRYPYADSEQRMYDVMMCESGGDASNVNPAGPYSGLFQYSHEKWNGDWNDYRGYDMNNPKVQIFATALAWEKNMQNQWRCYSPASVDAAAKPADVPATTAASEVIADVPQPSAPQAAPAQPQPVAPIPAPESAPRAPQAASGNASIEQYRTWIAEARAKHPYADSEQRMYDVMMCESRGNAKIVNPAGPYSGLFQYATGTWNGNWNDYRQNDILDARAQIFATAQAWQKNMQRQWGCYGRSH